MDSKTNNTKQVFWVSIGSLFAFGFSTISSMILARYFSKNDYGTYKQVLYVYTTLLTVFTLGLPKAFSYFLPRININQAKKLIKKITNLFFLLGGVFSILLFVFSSSIAIVLKNPNLSYALKIFSPVPFFMLPTMGLDGILATYKRTQFLAIYTVLSKILMLLCVAFPVIILNGGYIQAIIGFAIASFINFLMALYLKFLPVKDAKKEPCKTTYKEIFQFSIPLLYASFWGIVISSADQFFISRFFGVSVFADFSNGSLELPFVGMIVGGTSTVLSPLFSKYIDEKADLNTKILPLWNNVFEKSVKLIYPLVIFFWFFSDIVMIVLYGDIYPNAGIYFRIKLIVNLFTLIAYAPLVLSIGATKFYAKVHMYSALALILMEYASVLIFNSPFVITIISVICQVGRIIAMLIFISRYFNVKMYSLVPLKLISKILLSSILLLMLIRYLFYNVLLFDGILLLILSFFMFSITYLVWSYSIGLDYLSIFKPLFLKMKK